MIFHIAGLKTWRIVDVIACDYENTKMDFQGELGGEGEG
jgi:hypothetical protein